MHDNNKSLWNAFVADGRPLINLSGLILIASGCFALFLCSVREFLPHDIRFLQMTPEQLCQINACKISFFMFHDRASFGGVLIATGILYLWLSEFPLKNREPWAWWALAVSGCFGFLSFLAYLGFGYLDTWHGIASLVLLPIFAFGLFRSYHPLFFRSARSKISSITIGRLFLLVSIVGIIGAGLTITFVGMTRVFVPQDLQFIGLSRAQINAINPRMIPLIAHDRAGFGGALLSCGIAMFYCVVYGKPARNLWQALALSGCIGFCAAIGIHPLIGYLNLSHLAPAVLGALIYAVGLYLSRSEMTRLRTNVIT
jgi:hypothetical protein